LRLRTINNEIFRCCAARRFKNKGVQAMLDAVIDFLPAPVDIPDVTGLLENGQPRRVGPATMSRSRSRVQDHDDPFVGNSSSSACIPGRELR